MYVHNIDPFVVDFGFWGLGIRWYATAYLMGFFFGYLVTYYMAKKETIMLKVEQVGDFVTYCAIGVMVGGRVGYCVFYAPESLIEFHSKFPFWEVLAVNKGGMSSHGGIIGVFIACIYFSKQYKIKLLQILDIVGMMGAWAFFMGRIANFINGELYGRPCPSDYKWGVKFPSEIYNWASYDPQKLKSLQPVIDKMAEFKAQGVQMAFDASEWAQMVAKYDYSNGARQQVNSILEQIIHLTQSSGHEWILKAIEPVLTPRYPSQLFQAGMEGLFVFIVCALLWLKPRKPGFIAGVFGLLYAIMRIIGEQFRTPDAHIGFQALGLTRGQWLSIAMVGLAVAFIVYALKQDNKPSGGWRKIEKK